MFSVISKHYHKHPPKQYYSMLGETIQEHCKPFSWFVCWCSALILQNIHTLFPVFHRHNWYAFSSLTYRLRKYLGICRLNTFQKNYYSILIESLMSRCFFLEISINLDLRMFSVNLFATSHLKTFFNSLFTIFSSKGIVGNFMVIHQISFKFLDLI